MKRFIPFLSIVLLFTVSMRCSKSPSPISDNPGTLITISPTGFNDTENLIQAIELAKKEGMEATVFLTEGDYFIESIDICDFCGSLSGDEAINTTISTYYDKSDIEMDNKESIISFICCNVEFTGIKFNVKLVMN